MALKSSWVPRLVAADSDGDGIADAVETNGGSSVNTDGDGLIDALDEDSDDDGVSDLIEGLLDPYGREIGMWRSSDDDGDGILTADEIQDALILGSDVDHDGILNWLTSIAMAIPFLMLKRALMTTMLMASPIT